MKCVIVVLASLLAANAAHAFTPSQGFWYNPSESGRGFDIEIQDSVMAVASYVYNQQGAPIWYTSAGTFNEGTETFTASFGSSIGGQCLGCPYVPPVNNVNAGGAMQIVFTSNETGTLYFQGGSTAIQHFNFGYNGKAGYLQGQWAFSFNLGGGVVSGQWINFSGYTSGSSGELYSQGAGAGDSATRALGLYDAATDSFIVAIDDGVGFTESYIFSGDNSRMSGSGWIETVGTPISGSGSPAAGGRILTPSELGRGASALAPMDAAESERLQTIVQARMKTLH